MSFETISLLLSWMELGALLAILFRLSSTFNLIANTQRELRRAVHHLGEHRGAELGISDASDGLRTARSPYARAGSDREIASNDLAGCFPRVGN
jgi:hypothetical protein